jgi:hypothetical protein
MAEVTYYVALPFIVSDDGVAAGVGSDGGLLACHHTNDPLRFLSALRG